MIPRWAAVVLVGCTVSLLGASYICDLHRSARPPAPTPVLTSYTEPRPVLTTLAIALECSGSERRVLSWGGDTFEQHSEVFGLEPRPERAEIWIVVLETPASAPDIGFIEWSRRPWYVPREWARYVVKHLHLTIGAGCVLGEQLGNY